MIKIAFEFDTSYGVFRDALHLPDDHAFTEDKIQAMKEQRLAQWLAILEAPPTPPQNTVLEIAGETYQKLEGVPPSGAKLVEVEGVWYYKV